MKKIMLVLLAITMLFQALFLTACSDTSEGTAKPAAETAQNEEKEKEQEQPAPEAEPEDDSGIGLDDITNYIEENTDIDLDAIKSAIGMYVYDKLKEHTIDFDIDNFSLDDFKDLISPEEITGMTVDELINSIAGNLTEEQLAEIKDLDYETLVKAVETKTELLSDLMTDFKNYAPNISFSIDANSGEITFDSAVLFDNDVSEVSNAGKESLEKFIPIYASVLLNDKFKGFVSEIIVEGHTDTNGTHEYNQTLSEKRAENVKAFCLSEESGLTEEQIAELSEMVKSVGYSYDYPIYDESGTVDLAASRRVSFKFIISFDNLR